MWDLDSQRSIAEHICRGNGTKFVNVSIPVTETKHCQSMKRPGLKSSAFSTLNSGSKTEQTLRNARVDKKVSLGTIYMRKETDRPEHGKEKR